MTKKTRSQQKKRKFAMIIILIIIIALIIGAVYLIKNKNNNSDKPKEPNPSENKQPTETGKITHDIQYSKDFSGEVPKEAEKVIIEYMDLYYQTLQTLKENDFTKFFSEESYEQAQINQTAISLLVNLRKMQINDLSVKNAHYTITYQYSKQKNGNLEIYFLEDNLVNFAFTENIDSKSYGIENTFTLEKVGDTYKIVAFDKVDDWFYMISQNYGGNTDHNLIDQELKNLKNGLLKDAEENVKQDKSWLEEAQNGATITPRSCDHSYDRDKAVAYAKKYVVDRNPEWSDYSEYGGNCQNYASQILLTGGIPRDYYGSAATQWKWYGEESDSSETANGRSASWAGVSSFYEYAMYNTGFGLCAKTGGNIFLAELGDILQVGYDGYWNHTVVAIDTVQKDGKVVDILITSNSLDREDFPISAYNYTDKRMAKIYGWNEN